jgi:Na+/pantothenate symporter
VVWTDVMQGIVMCIGVIILLFLTLSQVGGLKNATEQLKEMTPPESGTGVVTLGQAQTKLATLPKGAWLRLADGGIARLAEQASLAKGETSVEAKLLKITTPAEIERIAPTDFGFAVTATFTANETNGYGRGRKGVYVSAPGPHPEKEGGFLNVWIAISFFFFWAFGSAGQPSNMVRLMAFKGTNVLRNAILAVSVYYTIIYLLLVVIFSCARILLPGMEVDSDRIMPELAAKVTGNAGVPWLAGLLLAAPFAAVMSSVDSFLLMVSSAVVRDIYQNRINPGASETQLKRLSYLVTAVVGILAMLAVLNPPQYLQDLIVFATSGLAGCFLMPVLLGLYWPNISARGAIAGMLGGLGCHLSLYIAGYVIKGKFEAFKLLEFDPFIWSLVVSGLLCWLCSLYKANPTKNN